MVLDELHALVTSKRGDLLSLAMARLHRLSPGLAAIGLSATVREPDELRKYLVPQGPLPPPPSAGAPSKLHEGKANPAAGSARVPSPVRERDRVRDENLQTVARPRRAAMTGLILNLLVPHSNPLPLGRGGRSRPPWPIS